MTTKIKKVSDNPTAAPTLATPCTLGALRAWLAKVDVLGTGDEGILTVSTTSSTVTVSG